MTFKRTVSLLLTFVLLLGMMGQGLFLVGAHAEEAQQKLHATGAVAYATHNGKDFYLYADINDNGTAKQMVYANGSVSATSGVCYSLNAAEFTGSNAIPVRLYMKSAYEAQSGVGCFWLKAGTASDGKATFIYSYNHSATPGWDTGTAKENAIKWYHSFTWNGLICQQVPTDVEGKYDQYVLVCKQIALTAGGTGWRMVFVSANEVGTEGVYPVKLGQLSSCYFGSQWVSDENSHWHVCSCGAKSDEAEHTFNPTYDAVNHWNECVCGAKKDVTAHAFTTAKSDETSHWTECACGARSGETAHVFPAGWEKNETHHWHACSCGEMRDNAEHDYDEWVNDYFSNQKSQTCNTCGYVNVQDLDHTCVAADQWLSDGEYHWKVCGECLQIIESTKQKHLPKAEYVSDETSHWRLCSQCETVLGKADHSFTYETNDTQHWEKCACGKETAPADHNYGEWVVDVKPTEDAPGSKSRKCADCLYAQTAEIPTLLREATYYLTGKVDSVSQYFLHKSSGTGDTGFHTLHTTYDQATATKIQIVRTEVNGEYTYAVQYTDDSATVWYIYVNDENPKGSMDTGRTKALRDDRTTFLWDGQKQRLYQVETVDGVEVNYVLAFKTLTKTNGAEELRLVAVPESELGSGAVEARLEICHTHVFSTAWEKDADSHWKVCGCGEKSEVGTHTVTNWTVEKEATEIMPGLRTGSCDQCGYSVKEDIPATGVKTPAEGDIAFVSGVFDGVRYYYRHTVTGESITSTSPYSLYVTDEAAKATSITVRESGGAYRLTYPLSGKEYMIYINTSGAGVTAKTDAALVNFTWDEASGMLYQLEGDVRYVLALKMMTNTKTGSSELRLAAVPMGELSETVVPAIVQVTHVHSYSEDWKFDMKYHWKECSCGEKNTNEIHRVEEWTIVKEATEVETGIKTGYCITCKNDLEVTIPCTITPEPPAEGNRNVLSAVVDGVRYYFRHTLSGESVTTTTPYSLYTTDYLAASTIVHVKAVGDEYVLTFPRGGKTLYIYVNASGVGATSNNKASLVNFRWDAENQMLYQMEGNVKYVLVFKYMYNKYVGDQLRLTAVPMSEALAGDGVYVVQLCTGDTIPQTGDSSMIGLAGMLMAISFCAMAVLVIVKKKRI